MPFIDDMALLTEEYVDKKVLNTTTVNQALGLPGMTSTFNKTQLLNIRILAIVASSLSIATGLVGIFFMSQMDKRKKLFRHDLIYFLIICDFLKALILVIYPIVILANISTYANPILVNVLGWFTAFSIEGADFAIMFVAVHFALLIFKPNWKWRNKRTGNLEGGLFKYKAIIWPVTIIIPSLMASLVFINYNVINYKLVTENVNVVLDNNYFHFHFNPRVGGYKPWTAWCYLPPDPLWYKYVLSWGPRYILILSIFGIYCGIYIYVSNETRRLKRQFKEINTSFDDSSSTTSENKRPLWKVILLTPFLNLFRLMGGFFSLSLDDPIDIHENNKKRKSIHNLIKHPLHHQKNGQHLNENGNPFDDSDISTGPIEGSSSSAGYNSKQLNVNIKKPNPAASSSTRTSSSYIGTNSIELNSMSSVNNEENVHNSDNLTDLRLEFQRDAYNKLKKRRIQVQRNLRSIFIYPFSYIAVWFFPIVSDISQTHHEVLYGPIVGLSYLDTFIRPLSCLVHTFVFIIREKPWKLSWNVVEREYLLDEYQSKGRISEADIMKLCNGTLGQRGWYYRGKWNRMNCWKHNPQFYKRWLWYIGITFRSMKNCKFDYSDNCEDTDYWNKYYFVEETTETTIDSNNMSCIRRENITTVLSHTSNSKEIERMVHVPWYYRFIHYIPMIHGIDLDEFNRSLNMNKTGMETDLMIPGLQFSLSKILVKNNDNDKHYGNENEENNTSDNIPTTSTITTGSTNNSNIPQTLNTYNIDSMNKQNNSLSKAPGNSSAIQNSITRISNHHKYDGDVIDDVDGEIDMLTFLNGPAV